MCAFPLLNILYLLPYMFCEPKLPYTYGLIFKQKRPKSEIWKYYSQDTIMLAQEETERRVSTVQEECLINTCPYEMVQDNVQF